MTQTGLHGEGDMKVPEKAKTSKQSTFPALGMEADRRQFLAPREEYTAESKVPWRYQRGIWLGSVCSGLQGSQAMSWRGSEEKEPHRKVPGEPEMTRGWTLTRAAQSLPSEFVNVHHKFFLQVCLPVPWEFCLNKTYN